MLPEMPLAPPFLCKESSRDKWEMVQLRRLVQLSRLCDLRSSDVKLSLRSLKIR